METDVLRCETTPAFGELFGISVFEPLTETDKDDVPVVIAGLDVLSGAFGADERMVLAFVDAIFSS